MTKDREIELLRIALSTAERTCAQWIVLGNEVLAHLTIDAKMNGSAGTSEAYGKIKLAPDGLYGRLLAQATAIQPTEVRAVFVELVNRESERHGPSDTEKDCGFVFLDGRQRPFLCKPWGGKIWLFYWHAECHWASLREISEAEAAKLPRNLSFEHQQVYHRQHAVWEAHLAPQAVE